jgi:hypothetical protein
MVNFVLDYLSSDVTMDVSGHIHSAAIVDLTDISAVAILQVSVDDMKSVFKFQTDSNDVVNTDGSDIKYQVDMTDWPELNPANGMMDASASSGAIATANSAGALASNKMLVAHDFVRYLAKKLFNTHYGVDLFDNELELLNDLRTICGSASAGQTWKDINDKLTAVSKSGTHAGIAGSEGAKYMTNATDTSANLCKVLFDQIMTTEQARFSSIVASDSFQSIPFEAGDSISFKLSISPAENQEDLTGVAALDARNYRIKLLFVDGAAVNTEVAANELP